MDSNSVQEVDVVEEDNSALDVDSVQSDPKSTRLDENPDEGDDSSGREDYTSQVIGPSLGINAFSKKHDHSRATTYNEIKAGRLKAKKLGTRTIITAEAEREWLDSLPELEVNNAA